MSSIDPRSNEFTHPEGNEDQPSWHDACLVVEDRRFENDGTSVWWAIHSPDGKYYLDENDHKWKPNPQMMAGWFMSKNTARSALNIAPCPPGVEPTEADWSKAGQVEPAPGVEARTADGRFVSGTGFGGERR